MEQNNVKRPILTLPPDWNVDEIAKQYSTRSSKDKTSYEYKNNWGYEFICTPSQVTTISNGKEFIYAVMKLNYRYEDHDYELLTKNIFITFGQRNALAFSIRETIKEFQSFIELFGDLRLYNKELSLFRNTQPIYMHDSVAIYEKFTAQERLFLNVIAEDDIIPSLYDSLERNLREKISGFIESFSQLDSIELKIMLFYSGTQWELGPFIGFIHFNSERKVKETTKFIDKEMVKFYERLMTFFWKEVDEETRFKDWTPTNKDLSEILLSAVNIQFNTQNLSLIHDYFLQLHSYPIESKAFRDYLENFTLKDIKIIVNILPEGMNYYNSDMIIKLMKSPIETMTENEIENKTDFMLEKVFYHYPYSYEDKRADIKRELSRFKNFDPIFNVEGIPYFLSSKIINEICELPPDSDFIEQFKWKELHNFVFDIFSINFSTTEAENYCVVAALLEKLGVWGLCKLASEFSRTNCPPLHLSEWSHYISYYHLYKDMPMSWWAPLVQNY